MSPNDAARLLDVPPDAPPEQLESRFNELRRQLEDKIAKAPTPGLQAKYRASLAEITTALETLVLTADGSQLPVLQRDAEAPTSAVPTPAPEAEPADSAPTVRRASPTARKSAAGGREFLVVAVLAVIVLGAGGWWVMKVRAGNAERARQEAAARAAEEEEARRRESLLTALRAKQAEATIRWTNLEKELQAAERRLSEARSDARNTRDLPEPQVAELQARLTAHTDYVRWLQNHVGQNTAAMHLAKLDAYLSSKASSEAEAAEADLARQLAAAEDAVREQKDAMLALTAPVRIDTEPAGLDFTYRDAYGRTGTETSPFEGEMPLGSVTVRYQREGWVDQEKIVHVARGAGVQVSAEFGYGTLHVTSEPSDLPFEVSNASGHRQDGRTPRDVEVPAGEAVVRWMRPEWPEIPQTVDIRLGGRETLFVRFVPASLAVLSKPAGVAFVYRNEAGFTATGNTPATIEVPPGPATVAFTYPGFDAVVTPVTTQSAGKHRIEGDLQSQERDSLERWRVENRAATIALINTLLASGNNAIAATEGATSRIPSGKLVGPYSGTHRFRVPARALSGGSGGYSLRYDASVEYFTEFGAKRESRGEAYSNLRLARLDDVVIKPILPENLRYYLSHMARLDAARSTKGLVFVELTAKRNLGQIQSIWTHPPNAPFESTFNASVVRFPWVLTSNRDRDRLRNAFLRLRDLDRIPAGAVAELKRLKQQDEAVQASSEKRAPGVATTNPH